MTRRKRGLNEKKAPHRYVFIVGEMLSGKLEIRQIGDMNENEGSAQIYIHYAATINHGLYPDASNHAIDKNIVCLRVELRVCWWWGGLCKSAIFLPANVM